MINKIYTSYFYQIRNFKRNMLPLSTACFDPKWYHANKGPDYVWCDKHFVINGFRAPLLHPDETCDYQCAECRKTGDPATCDFLKKYAEQLSKLDAVEYAEMLDKLVARIKKDLDLSYDLIPVLIVHEAPNNECSERKVIQEFFTSRGIPCEELTYPIENMEV